MTSDHPDFLSLTDALSAQLAILNGEENDFYARQNRTSSLRHCVVAYAGETPVACGAFRPKTPAGDIEIKRMYTLPAHRGHGHAATVLAELEAWATEAGFGRAVLETSVRLESAVRLYVRSGYVTIPNYEPYVGIEDSVCMAKRLA